MLHRIVDRAGPLRATPARDGQPIELGAIVVAPPDHHLMVEAGRVRCVRGPKVNGHRPAVDVLFHSAARAYGDRVIGVVLSGALSDGSLGLRAIKRRGGGAIVQSDALHQGMPTSAIAQVDVDCVVPLLEIPGALTMLMRTREEHVMGKGRDWESDLEAGFDLGTLTEVPGEPSGFMCPECGGALWELNDEGLRAYTCHVGHSFSAEAMLEQHGESAERALWTAVRILEERRVLVRRLAERMEEGGQTRSAKRFAEQASEVGTQAAAIRRLIEPSPSADDDDASDLDPGRAA